MFHIYGVAAFACGLLATGSTIVVLSKFELGEMLGAIEKYRVTHLPLVPPILLALTKTEIANNYDLKSLHSVTCGAAPLSKELTEEFISRFPSVTLMQAKVSPHCFEFFIFLLTPVLVEEEIIQ